MLGIMNSEEWAQSITFHPSNSCYSHMKNAFILSQQSQNSYLVPASTLKSKSKVSSKSGMGETGGVIYPKANSSSTVTQ